MSIKKYTVPPECKRVTVEIEGNRVITIFEPEKPSDQTGKDTAQIKKHPKERYNGRKE